MSLVSSSSITGSDAEFILRGMSFIYIMNSWGGKRCSSIVL